jgi:hypothetical protein
MPSAGFAYAPWKFGWRSLFLTNRRGAENTEKEKGDAFGWLRLRTLEILQVIAFFNEPQRRREHGGRREEAIAFTVAYRGYGMRAHRLT